MEFRGISTLMDANATVKEVGAGWSLPVTHAGCNTHDAALTFMQTHLAMSESRRVVLGVHFACSAIAWNTMVNGAIWAGLTYRFTINRWPSLLTSYVKTSVEEIAARP